jgi:hypothetical protein
VAGAGAPDGGGGRAAGRVERLGWSKSGCERRGGPSSGNGAQHSAQLARGTRFLSLKALCDRVPKACLDHTLDVREYFVLPVVLDKLVKLNGRQLNERRNAQLHVPRRCCSHAVAAGRPLACQAGIAASIEPQLLPGPCVARREALQSAAREPVLVRSPIARRPGFRSGLRNWPALRGAGERSGRLAWAGVCVARQSVVAALLQHSLQRCPTALQRHSHSQRALHSIHVLTDAACGATAHAGLVAFRCLRCRVAAASARQRIHRRQPIALKLPCITPAPQKPPLHLQQSSSPPVHRSPCHHVAASPSCHSLRPGCGRSHVRRLPVWSIVKMASSLNRRSDIGSGWTLASTNGGSSRHGACETQASRANLEGPGWRPTPETILPPPAHRPRR